MANNFEPMSETLKSISDEIYKNESKTAVLDATDVINTPDAKTVLIYTTTTTGFRNHTRTGSIKEGGINTELTPYTYDIDRSIRFFVDTMDNIENASMPLSKGVSEFTRVKAVPEIDAITFSALSQATGILKATPSTYANGEAFLTALLAGAITLDEAEVSRDNRILFVTPTLYQSVKALDTSKSREALAGFSSIVEVPQSRFYTDIDLLDTEAGGYAKATGGADINFMIAQKDAVIKSTKRTLSKIVEAPEADGYIVKMRNYMLADVLKNKANGIYLSSKA